MPNIENGESCLTAADILAGRSPDNEVARTRGAGCKNDGGPLWITVQLQDDPEEAGAPMTVWGRIY